MRLFRSKELLALGADMKGPTSSLSDNEDLSDHYEHFKCDGGDVACNVIRVTNIPALPGVVLVGMLNIRTPCFPTARTL